MNLGFDLCHIAYTGATKRQCILLSPPFYAVALSYYVKWSIFNEAASMTVSVNYVDLKGYSSTAWPQCHSAISNHDQEYRLDGNIRYSYQYTGALNIQISLIKQKSHWLKADLGAEWSWINRSCDNLLISLYYHLLMNGSVKSAIHPCCFIGFRLFCWGKGSFCVISQMAL